MTADEVYELFKKQVQQYNISISIIQLHKDTDEEKQVVTEYHKKGGTDRRLVY